MQVSIVGFDVNEINMRLFPSCDPSNAVLGDEYSEQILIRVQQVICGNNE